MLSFLSDQSPFQLKSIAEADLLIYPSGADICAWDCVAADEVECYLDAERCCYQMKEDGRTCLVLRNDVCNLPEGTMPAAQRLSGPNGDNRAHAGKVQGTAASNSRLGRVGHMELSMHAAVLGTPKD